MVLSNEHRLESQTDPISKRKRISKGITRTVSEAEREKGASETSSPTPGRWKLLKRGFVWVSHLAVSVQVIQTASGTFQWLPAEEFPRWR